MVEKHTPWSSNSPSNSSGVLVHWGADSLQCEGAKNQWLVALSVRPTRNHCSPADDLCKTLRVMAALRRKKAFVFPSVLTVCCPNQCDKRRFELAGLGSLSLSVKFCNQKKLALRVPGCCIGENDTHTHTHTHIQNRAASWDNNGGENIGLPGCLCESSGFPGCPSTRQPGCGVLRVVEGVEEGGGDRLN